MKCRPNEALIVELIDKYAERPERPYRTPKKIGQQGPAPERPSLRPFLHEAQLADAPPEDPERTRLGTAIVVFAQEELVSADGQALRDLRQDQLLASIREIWASRAPWLIRARSEWAAWRALAHASDLDGLRAKARDLLVEDLQACVEEASSIQARDSVWIEKYASRILPDLAGYIRRFRSNSRTRPTGLQAIDADQGTNWSGADFARACLGEAEEVVRNLLVDHMPAQFTRRRPRGVPEGPPEERFASYLLFAAKDRYRKSLPRAERDRDREHVAKILRHCLEAIQAFCARHAERRVAILTRGVNSGRIPLPASALELWSPAHTAIAVLALVLDRFAVPVPAMPGEPVRRTRSQSVLRLEGSLTQRDLAPFLQRSAETVNKRLGWKQQLEPSVLSFLSQDPEWLEHEEQLEREMSELEQLLAMAGEKIKDIESSPGAES